MIGELFLITELLKQTVGTPNSTSKAPSPIPYEAPATPRNLFAVGPTTEIKQSFTLPPLAPSEVATAYLEAATGRPEKIGTGGRF